MSFRGRGATAATAATADRHPARGAPGVDSDGYRCEAETLLRDLDRLLAERRASPAPAGASLGASGRSAGLAVFLIQLRRDDRTRALAGLASARQVQDRICERIARLLRPGDRFVCHGVDEILLVLPAVDSVGQALLVASRLVRALGEPMHDVAVPTRVRPAIGCALFPAHGDDAEALIGAADRASSAARTAIEGYRIAERGEAATDRSQLSGELEAALKANQLQVWLQPQLNLHTGRFDAAEALIRWPRAEGLPPVSPIVAVQLAEDQGLMPELTLFVLNTVLRQSARFAARGQELRIAVNVSASMLTDETLPGTVEHALALWEVPPHRLTLEVTENTLMDNVEGALAILHRLKEVGTHLSLDDFGTGYSSFAYLRRMPLDELKIDQLFIRTLSVLPDGSVNPQRDDDLRIVRSIIDMAHNFDLQTVAEGVEDAETLALLKSLGCDVIQGYFTGRPMPIPQAEDWWRALPTR